MAIKIMSWVFDESPTDGAERLVLLALADNASEEGICWPSLNTIAGKAGITRRSVYRTMHDLQDKGIVVVEHRTLPNKVASQTNIYCICWTEEIRRAKRVEQRYQAALTLHKIKRSLGTQSPQARDTESPGVGTQSPQGRDTESPKSYVNHQIEPSVNRQLNPPPPTSPQSAPGEEEEGLSDVLKAALRDIGVYPKLWPEIAQIQQDRGVPDERLLKIATAAKKDAHQESPAGLFVYRTRELPRQTASIGYTNTNPYAANCCTRCYKTFAPAFLRTVSGAKVCLDCLTDDEYATYQS